MWPADIGTGLQQGNQIRLRCSCGPLLLCRGSPNAENQQPLIRTLQRCARLLANLVLHIIPHTRQRLATDMLEKEHAAVQDSLSSYMSTLPHAGTVTSDGWQDARSRPLLNILLVTCKGSCFLRAVEHIWQGQARLAVLS